MKQHQAIHSEEELPFRPIENSHTDQATDANAGASEGYLGQRQSPDAVGGLGHLVFEKKRKSACKVSPFLIKLSYLWSHKGTMAERKIIK